jgi:DNA-binding transcriptional ArsR family regulator
MMDERSFELHAEMLNALAHPKRLIIVELLRAGEKTVGELASELDISLQNTSQHLRVMRDRGLVLARKEAQTVYYTLTSLTLADCCDRVRREMVDVLLERGRLFEGLNEPNRRIKNEQR